MKKKFLVIVLLVGVLFISTGCDKKQTLVCTNSQKSTGMTINTTATTDFVNDKITTMKMDMEVVVDESYASYVDTIKDSLVSQYSKYDGKDGFTYSANTKDNVINFTMTLDSTKASDEVKSGLGFAGSEKYSVNKKSLESQGYTCK